MGKPFQNSLNCIGRELVTQYCNYSLQFESCGWDILTREVTNVECLDIFLECIPRLLIMDDHTFYDEPKHRDGTTRTGGLNNAAEGSGVLTLQLGGSASLGHT